MYPARISSFVPVRSPPIDPHGVLHFRSNDQRVEASIGHKFIKTPRYCCEYRSAILRYSRLMLSELNHSHSGYLAVGLVFQLERGF